MKDFGKGTTISEILKQKGAIDILVKHNLPCLSCPYAQYEINNLKIGEVCEMYNMDLKKILLELNKIKGGTAKKK